MLPASTAGLGWHTGVELASPAACVLILLSPENQNFNEASIGINFLWNLLRLSNTLEYLDEA